MVLVGSLLHWSAEAPSYKSSFEWLTNDELFVGGLSASVALDMGTSSSAYAGVGFTYSSVPVDLSGWGGICVYYRADKDMRVVLAADSLEADYVLDASENPVEKCISWGDFSSSGLEKKASDIKFEVRSNENVYNQIKFNIIAVGKYLTDGACIIDSSKLTNQ